MKNCSKTLSQLNRLANARLGIAREYEFVAYKAGIAHLLQHDSYGGVVELLQVVEFATPGISCGVNVADNVLALLQPAQDFTVHDLRMVDIKQQLEPE